MTRESTDIEVEVVEIDGVAPVNPEPRAEEPLRDGDWQDWRKYSGRIRSLDSRWWPLWAILGIIALALFLTVGLVVGAVFLIVRLCVNVIRSILR